MVITTSQLHTAFSDFVLYLRGHLDEVEAEVSGVSARLTVVEESGVGGVGAEALQGHILAAEPHSAYDRDLPSLTVLFDNLIA